MSSGVLRPRPDDFWTTYVDIGKPGCEAYYRAHWKTVDRWVEECGKVRLRAARAEEVARRRQAKKKPAKPASPLIDKNPPDRWDMHAACEYLRDKVTVVGINERGEYFVGAKVMLASDILTLALARGMDEWYIEQHMLKMLSLFDGVDEWVLDRELS